MTITSPRIASLIVAVASVFLVTGCRFGRGSLHLSEAEEQLRLKQYDDAIASYRAHIDHRLEVEDRPAWENPYFYLMLIVDIEVNRDNISGARAALAEAEAKGVDSTLIADRWRSLARWYELHGENREAFELLQAQRQLDTLLFDAALDRLAKQIVKEEETAVSREKSN
jgi:tetratricopeptide (TPR) repeat protein